MTIVGINWRDETADALDMLRRAGNPYTAIGVDPDTTAVLDLGVYGAPESYLIDKQGVIRFKQLGAITPALWNSELEALVKRLEDLDESRVARAAMHPRLQQPMRTIDMAYFAAEHDDQHLATITEIRRRL